MKVIFHESAAAELNEAAQFYDSVVEGLGSAFLLEVEHAIGRIELHPAAGRKVMKVVRCMIIRRFPYSIMYSVSDEVLFILAITNQKRRPLYWRDRT